MTYRELYSRLKERGISLGTHRSIALFVAELDRDLLPCGEPARKLLQGPLA
ncbi:hypothetical protein [Thermofilum sp.]|uniref:hypothetical protein n=1 Tax=Thermofilum sp. TaxID=1961369 RepID=UPI0031642D84